MTTPKTFFRLLVAVITILIAIGIAAFPASAATPGPEQPYPIAVHNCFGGTPAAATP